MSSWAKDPWTWGALPGLAVAGAAAVRMLGANALTINPYSSLVLVAVLLALGAAAGFVAGWLGGRAALVFRRPFADGALALSVLSVGHLLLPTGAALVLAVPVVVLQQIRRRVLPRATRLDLAFPVGIVALFLLLPDSGTSLPPTEPASVPLASASPLPGSMPVTISVHTDPEFPGVPAIHLPLRPLASKEPGRRSALWTGRLPDRTRAGRELPHRLPGGGGIARWPVEAPGLAWMASWFPSPGVLDGTPFAPSGTLTAQAEAAGIPVLRGAPADDDPPYYLRILDGEHAPDLDTAMRLRHPGAWIDVTLSDSGGRLALSGQGFRLVPTRGEVNLVDVTPTALHLLGLPVPRSCDGRVLLEVMRSPGPGARPPRYRELVESAGPDDDVSRLTTSR